MSGERYPLSAVGITDRRRPKFVEHPHAEIVETMSG